MQAPDGHPALDTEGGPPRRDGRSRQVSGTAVLDAHPVAALTAAVVDHCPARRHGIGRALAEAGWAVEDPGDLAAWLRGPGPRVAVVSIADDADLAELALTCARCPRSVVVAAVPRASHDLCTAALRAGAAGVVWEDGELRELVAVVTATGMGFSVVPREAVHALATSAREAARPKLSERDVALLRAVAAGSTVADIAAESAYSIRSTYRHLARLYRRLGASSRTEALLAASRLGLIS